MQKLPLPLPLDMKGRTLALSVKSLKDCSKRGKAMLASVYSLSNYVIPSFLDFVGFWSIEFALCAFV